MDLISLADVDAAAERIRGRVLRTPLLGWPGEDPRLLLKPESLQPVGAFKIRGATSALLALDPGRRRAGVVTHSSGNHGRALAYAARAEGVPCTVVVPRGAPAVKVDAVRALGAEVVVVEPAARAAAAERIAASTGRALVPPFDDREVIAGQGTVGREIAADLPDAATVLVPVGGGGLASGVAAALAELSPGTAVVGVEPELAADAAEGLAAGHRVVWPPERTGRTVADGVRVGPSELTFAHLAALLDGIVTVTEEEILAAVRALAVGARIVAEPSGALAAAAFLAGRAGGGKTVAVVSGGNADPALLSRVLAGAGPGGGSPSPPAAGPGPA
ncbi:threonine ammonia-lyase [Nocardiopsis coralliicola]